MISALVVGLGLVAGVSADPTDRAAYETAREQAGKDPAAQVRLALWCEAHGFEPERIKHLAKAIVLDPKNAAARGLMGMVAFAGRWERADDVSGKVKQDAQLAASLALYNARRDKVANTADAHWRLALWCAEKGLNAEATAHLSTVVRLDPGREAAWKRLGYKKQNGRWVTDAQVAAARKEAQAQKEADRHWKPILAKLKTALGQPAKRDEAQKELAEIADPRAVPMAWHTFATGDASSQQVAVQVLGQIDAGNASRGLAALSISGKSAEVRRRATETLKQRDPREFADVLIALLRKPIKYEVKPVGGPGSPGALFIEGKQANLQRMYAPPPMPNIPLFWGEPVGYDQYGLPVISRMVGFEKEFSATRHLGSFKYSQLGTVHSNNPGAEAAIDAVRRDPSQVLDPFLAGRPITQMLWNTSPSAFNHVFSWSLDYGVSGTRDEFVTIPIGQIAVQYQKSALSAQQQLAGDVSSLDSYNKEVKRTNELVADTLHEITGEEPKSNLDDWKAWWVNLQGYRYYAPSDEPRPTLVQNVPLAVLPQPVPLVRTDVMTNVKTGYQLTPTSSVSCFGAGTLVRTLEGPRPIEEIKIGDRVLAQDISTGALDYSPVVVVHHNPPSPTFLVKLPGETIVSSPFHRFWVAGRGWVMARSLQAGDRLRMLDGLQAIESVETGEVQLVYNLDVANQHDFFAGSAGALVHDNSLPELRLAPFDAPQVVARAETAEP